MVRTNTNVLFLFKTDNMGELKKIWEDYTIGGTFKRFIEIYKKLMGKPYSFIQVNTQNDPSHQLISNMTHFVRL